MSFRLVALLIAAGLLIPACSGNINDTDSFPLLVTSRVSVDSLGGQANGASAALPAISQDGRFVAFDSFASNLTPGGTGGFRNVFRHDRLTGATVKVSDPGGGVNANGDSLNPSISGDGRFVAFESVANNLVPGDTNGVSDIFLWDGTTGALTRVSLILPGPVEPNGASNFAAISQDGNFVAFISSASNIDGLGGGLPGVFLWARAGGALRRVDGASGGGAPNGPANGLPAISSDGHFVAFQSFAGNLLAVPYVNSGPDIFIWDQTGALATRRVSVMAGGGDPNGSCGSLAMSGDGRFVAFESGATNLMGTADTNGVTVDIFLRDLSIPPTSMNHTIVVSVTSEGFQGAFPSNSPSISSDGQRIAFVTVSPLVVEDTNGSQDVYVRDLSTGSTARYSVRTYGGQTLSGMSSFPAISADGSTVAFTSTATNLVDDDTNGVDDIFERGPQ